MVGICKIHPHILISLSTILVCRFKLVKLLFLVRFLSESIVIFLQISDILLPPVDVGKLPNHVKYCVSVFVYDFIFNLNFKRFRTTNWYQSYGS